MKKLLLIVAMMLISQSAQAQGFGCVNDYYNCKNINTIKICKMDFNDCMRTKEVYLLKDNQTLVDWDDYIEDKQYNPNEWMEYTIKVKFKK